MTDVMIAVQLFFAGCVLGLAGWGLAVVSRITEVAERPGVARGYPSFWLGLALGILGPLAGIVAALIYL